MSRHADNRLKTKAEELASLLGSTDLRPQEVNDTLARRLQQLQQQQDETCPQEEAVINFANPKHGRTAVHLAASNGLWQCLEVLLKHGGDPNAVSNNRDLKQTPLHLAARGGNGKCVEVLLDNGVDYTIKTSKGDTALALAADQICREQLQKTIARLEVPKRSRPEEDIVKKLHGFADKGQDHHFFQLYTNQPKEKVDLSVRWYDKWVDDSSQRSGSEGNIKADSGTMWYETPEPGTTETLLYRSCRSDSRPIVEFILSKSLNQPLPNLKTGETPLHAAAENGNMVLVTRLLEHSPKLLLARSSSGQTALHLACLKGYIAVVKLLLDRVLNLVKGTPHMYKEDNTFSLDLPDNQGVTPLYLACLNGFPEIVKQLIGLRYENSDIIGLTVNSATVSGHTALHASACSGKREVVDMLFRSGEADPEILAPPHPNSTGILWRAIGGNEKADPGTRKICLSPSGKFVAREGEAVKNDRPLRLTVLTEACIHGHASVISLLLKRGVRDDTGVAVRVLCALKLYPLCQTVLSYHCKIKRKENAKGSLVEPEDFWKLDLLWADKKIPTLEKEWFKVDTTFHPQVQKSDYDDGNKRLSQLRRKRAVSMANQLPRSIDLRLVKNVYLKGNSLTTLPLEFFKLPNVRFIDLSKNQLTSLPFSENEIGGASGWECLKLREIRLSENQLTELPPGVWYLPELKIIIADNNRLERLATVDTVVSTLGLSKTLENIDFSSNALTEIDPFLVEILSLTIICFRGNRLTGLPLKMWDLPNLVDLNLSGNQLTELTPADEDEGGEEGEGVNEVDTNIERTQSEETMSHPAMVRGTRVTTARITFRPQLSHFPSLEREKSIDAAAHLSMAGVPGQGGPVAHDQFKLKKLDISDNSFKEFPHNIPCVAPNLEELNVSNNPGITKVDIHFVPTSLRRFLTRDCRIDHFGNVLNKEELAQLKQTCVRNDLRLQSVCDHRNNGRLANLTTLNLRGNRLTHFQILLHDLPNSGAPNFAAEEKDFEKENPILLYPSLENLDLSSNSLQGKLNPNIAHLLKINAIDLKGNDRLLVIPYEFGYLKRLRNFTMLNLRDLPELVQPPKEIQDSMCQQILTFLAAGLKESQILRSIKLFLVGKTDAGKSSLLRRLSNKQIDKSLEKTVGIEIMEYNYAPPKPSMFSRGRQPVHFSVWDFAGEDQYHATYHCFYSRCSLYLVVYNMKNDQKGISELDSWLRNIKLRAPGCPVLVVGTHMDQIKYKRIEELETLTRVRYMDNRTYPHVVQVMSVSCIQRMTKNDNIEMLKKALYDISVHLHVGRDGHSLTHNPEMEEDSPRALFRQQVPKSFLLLRDDCQKYAKQCRDWAEPTNKQPHPHQTGAPAGSVNGTATQTGTGQEGGDEERKDPVMDEEEFRQRFGETFNYDKDEMDEAVSFLHLQGTLLHYDDHNLKDLYFLDPQWLAKLMAHVVRIQSIHHETMAIDGVLPVEELFKDHHFPETLKQKYIQLLEKFEVALTFTSSQVLIPSLLPEMGHYPQTGDSLKGITYYSDDFYFTVLRRFWLAEFIHKGFWPRLICRISNDQQIGQILRKLIGEADSSEQTKTLAGWAPWKMGVAFSYRGRTLLVVKEEENEAPDTEDDEYEWLPAKRRIEIHVYAQDWFEVQQELFAKGQTVPLLQQTFSLPGIATQLLMKISSHILSLSKLYRGLLQTQSVYIPCWKCYGNLESGKTPTTKNSDGGNKKSDNHYFPVKRNGKNIPVYAFHHERCIILAAQRDDPICPMHGPIKVIHTAPDLIFWDLASLSEYQQDMSSELRITKDETIGRGGYGFVCEGELVMKNGETKPVAVKGFLSPEHSNNTQDCTVQELLEISKQQQNLYYAYREIRQEVSFMAVLNNDYLTRLVGVRTSPYMCLMLELAPRGSLSKALKVYKKYDAVLEAVTLQKAISQIAQGMDYLHKQQIIHKDMKAANVLVWKFPWGSMTKEKRVEKADRVLLKLTDYGISQVFTKPTMKLTGQPEGTPGFMAPELFGPDGHEISTEKVDVFAFGMVIYELLSLQSPFASADFHKRNPLVKDGKRPVLPIKAMWSPLMIQDLMTACWSHDPEKRPTMEAVTECVSTEEFGRLRAEISIERVESVSCACVCRITVDDAEQEEQENTSLSNGIGHNSDMESSVTSSVRFDLGYGGLPDMDPCTDYTRLHYEPPSIPRSGTNILPPMQNERGHLVADGSEDGVEDQETKAKERSNYLRQFSSEAYTQVWVCDSKEKGGLLEIFSYCDTQPSYLAFVCKCRDPISAICPVRNMMWIGTTNGILKLKQISTLSTKYKGELKSPEELMSPRKLHVLSIAHVERTSSVIVSTDAGEIWAFSDRLTDAGLVIEERIKLRPNTNCYKMAAVEVDGSVEVWGTSDESQLIMFKKQGKGWTLDDPYQIEGNKGLNFFCIAYATYMGKTSEHHHLWVSYRHKGTVVSWDLRRRQYRNTISTASFTQTVSSSMPHPKVTALAATGRKVLVGTQDGAVGVVDSKTCLVITCLSWHTSKIRSLLVMPPEMEPCVCSELPLPELERDDSVGTKLARKPTRMLVHQKCMSETDFTSISDNNPTATTAAGTNTTDGEDGDTEETSLRGAGPMVASIGNGRGGGGALDETNSDKKNVTLLLWRS